MTTEGGIKKENNGCESPSRQIHAPGTLGNMQEQSKKRLSFNIEKTNLSN
jgi:hypothetical protein